MTSVAPKIEIIDIKAWFREAPNDCFEYPITLDINERNSYTYVYLGHNIISDIKAGYPI